MIEDMYIAVAELGAVSFQVSKKNNALMIMGRREKKCFRPGSNRGPCACEAHVITATLRKQLECLIAKYVPLLQLAELRGDEELNFDFVIRGTRSVMPWPTNS